METDAKLVSDFKGRPGESIFCVNFTGGGGGDTVSQKVGKGPNLQHHVLMFLTSFVLQYV